MAKKAPAVAIEPNFIQLPRQTLSITPAIDALGMLQRGDELVQQLSDVRTSEPPSPWYAQNAASLRVNPKVSCLTFYWVYQSMAMAGLSRIRIVVNEQEYDTTASLAFGCDTSLNNCPLDVEAPARADAVLHAEVDADGWRLRVHRQADPIDVTRTGSRATDEEFAREALRVASLVRIDRFVFHIVPGLPFSRLTPFLSKASELMRSAGPPSRVTFAIRSIDAVQFPESDAAPARRSKDEVRALKLIDQVVEEQGQQVDVCLFRVLQSDPRSQGQVSVRFIIAPDGSVEDARATRSGSVPLEVAGCVEAAFSALRFKPPTKGRALVEYPLPIGFP